MNDTQAIILFDGVCNLCNRSVQFVIRHDREAYFRFASQQGKAGQELLNRYGLSSTEINSFVLIEYGNAYTKSTAALKVARRLKGPVRLLAAFMIVPPFIRDAVYKVIARNRYKWFGKKESCMIPSPQIAKRFLN